MSHNCEPTQEEKDKALRNRIFLAAGGGGITAWVLWLVSQLPYWQRAGVLENLQKTFGR